jgi:hypothetical protein
VKKVSVEIIGTCGSNACSVRKSSNERGVLKPGLSGAGRPPRAYVLGGSTKVRPEIAARTTNVSNAVLRLFHPPGSSSKVRYCVDAAALLKAGGTTGLP